MALAEPGTSRNKTQQAYDAVAEMITFQELPPGTMLSESIVMDATGLGRTPVREALQRLARERMVDIHPSRGVFVAPVSVDSQLQLLELRRTLEGFAVRLASQRANPEQRHAMLLLADALEHSDKGDSKGFGVLLKQDHELITAATKNDYLAAAMAPLQGLSRRFWFANLKRVEQELTTAAQLHADILRTVSEGNGQAATAASLKLNDYLREFAYKALPVDESTAVDRNYDHPADGQP